MWNDYVALPTKDHTRWKSILKVLSENKTFTDIESFINVVLSYNDRFKNEWMFDGLDYYFKNVLTSEERRRYCTVLLPKIGNLARQLPSLLPKLPVLRVQQAKTLSLHAEQIGCLLANGFFCTYMDCSTYRTANINFNKIFALRDGGEKLKCIFNYFDRFLSKSRKEFSVITIQRLVLRENPSWASSGKLLHGLKVYKDGTIEDDGSKMIQMDFANRRIGGGVLRGGSVQEEIRFLISPELIATMLICEEMTKNEAILIKGIERFSMYTGYGGTFKWAGNYRDETPSASWHYLPDDKNLATLHPDSVWNRRCSKIIALDAYNFAKNPKHQYSIELIERELNKAFVGFSFDGGDEENIPVATGNWGCGAYKGSRELKSVIQLMAAALAERDLVYFTFGDSDFQKRLTDTHAKLVEKMFSIGQLYGLIRDHNHSCREHSLFDRILQIK